MTKIKKETRGRPRDSIYEAIAEDILTHVKRYPKKQEREWVYDIMRKDEPLPLDNRYQGFRQSLTYKELKATLKAKGYKILLSLANGFDVTIKITRV